MRMQSVLENHHNMLLTVGLCLNQSDSRMGELPVRLDLERNSFTCWMLGRISQRWPESSLTLRAKVHSHLDPKEHHLYDVINLSSTE